MNYECNDLELLVNIRSEILRLKKRWWIFIHLYKNVPIGIEVKDEWGQNLSNDDLKFVDDVILHKVCI